MALRAVPELTDFRPADANETAAAWRLALERKGPCFFALSRQDLPVHRSGRARRLCRREQGRVCAGRCSQAAGGADRHRLRSVACAGCREAAGGRGDSRRGWSASRAGRSSRSRRRSTRPACCRRACRSWPSRPGATLGWWKYVGLDGDVIGLDRFGASAPGPIVMKELGFSAENVAARAKKLVK